MTLIQTYHIIVYTAGKCMSAGVLASHLFLPSSSFLLLLFMSPYFLYVNCKYKQLAITNWEMCRLTLTLLEFSIIKFLSLVPIGYEIYYLVNEYSIVCSHWANTKSQMPQLFNLYEI